MVDQEFFRVILDGSDSDKAKAYGVYLQSLMAEPLWSTGNPSGRRIPWRLAAAARKSAFHTAFACPGLYLFGSRAGVPLYVSMTEDTLWKRIRRRYVTCGRSQCLHLGCKRSQCQLAVDHETDLLARGIEGFPKEVRSWYREQYRNSTVRLDGAVAFAHHGIKGIWFSLLPVADSAPAGDLGKIVRNLEKHFIPVASAWNGSHGYPPLLNEQDI